MKAFKGMLFGCLLSSLVWAFLILFLFCLLSPGSEAKVNARYTHVPRSYYVYDMSCQDRFYVVKYKTRNRSLLVKNKVTWR